MRSSMVILFQVTKSGGNNNRGSDATLITQLSYSNNNVKFYFEPQLSKNIDSHS